MRRHALAERARSTSRQSPCKTAANMYLNISGANISDYDPGDLCCIPGAERYIVPALFAVIVLFGCLGNGLVLTVVLKNRDYSRNTTSLFIVNLAVADCVFLVGCVPFHAVIYTVDQWPFGGFMCKLVHLVQYSSMLASVFTLVAMALDRYLAVRYPLQTKHLRTPRVALIWSALVWLSALLASSPWPIVYTTRR